MVSPQSGLKPYLTAKEVVAVLLDKGIEVTDDTVRNWVLKGIKNKNAPKLRYKLGGIKIGGRIHILQASLAEWVQLVSHLSEWPD
jgi:hypothetical protein